MSEFWDDTAIEQVSDNRFKANITNRWSVSDIPNGGYLMSIAARTLQEALSHPDPLTITGHYADRSVAGPAELEVDIIREGNTVSTAAVRLMQEGCEKVRFTATFGDLEKNKGATWIGEAPPPIERDKCLTSPRFLPIHDRVELLFSPNTAEWLRGKSIERPEHELIMFMRDGTEPDILNLPLFSDCVPPTVFSKFGAVGWVPTLELTVHLRAKPAPGELIGRFRTRYLINGLMEEDGEIWDSRGELVALSRQLAKYRSGAL